MAEPLAQAPDGLGYISPEPARLNGNTAGSLPPDAARRYADHASSAARFSSAQSTPRR